MIDEFKPAWLENQVDALDATFFSGDSFFEKENADRMQWYLERWTRQLAVCREIGEA